MPQSLFDFQEFEKFSGDFVGRVTPVPIPNTEVKPAGADGTARETVWESRKSPGLFKPEARESILFSRAFVFPFLEQNFALADMKTANWIKRLGFYGFLFFLVKGLLWLLVPALIAMLARS